MPLTGDGSALEAYVVKHPDKINWVELSKTIIDHTLQDHPEVEQLTVKVASVQGAKPRAPLTLRGIRKKLKKGCIPKGYDLKHVEADVCLVLDGQSSL